MNSHWQIQGGASAPPSNGTQFFHFHIHFRQKAPVSEVGAPQRVGATLNDVKIDTDVILCNFI